MSYSKLFDSGFRKLNQDLFAAIIRTAMNVDKVNTKEKAFLDSLAQKLENLKEIHGKILKDNIKHPINPLAQSEKRMIRLFELAKMVYADAIKDVTEVRLLTKIAIGLGYSSKPQEIVLEALGIVTDQNIVFEKFKKLNN
ncbi:MAG: TerB family tellurite resistance protein [Bacteroidota bacterium]|nr:TerB family tellurite resistance protein [Bacteroidota bacterium]